MSEAPTDFDRGMSVRLYSDKGPLVPVGVMRRAYRLHKCWTEMVEILEFPDEVYLSCPKCKVKMGWGDV